MKGWLCGKTKETTQSSFRGLSYLEPKLVALEEVKPYPLVGFVLYPPPARVCELLRMVIRHCGRTTKLRPSCCTGNSTLTNLFFANLYGASLWRVIAYGKDMCLWKFGLFIPGCMGDSATPSWELISYSNLILGYAMHDTCKARHATAHCKSKQMRLLMQPLVPTKESPKWLSNTRTDQGWLNKERVYLGIFRFFVRIKNSNHIKRWLPLQSYQALTAASCSVGQCWMLISGSLKAS